MAGVRGFAQRASWRVWVAVALGVLVVGTLLFARLVEAALPGDSGSQRGAQSSDSAADEGAEPTWTPPHDGDALPDADVEPEVIEAPPEAVKVAENFVREWMSVEEGESQEQWWQRVSQYAHPRLVDLLRSTDPANVPVTKLTGDPYATRAVSTDVDMVFPTDIGDLEVLCIFYNGSWVVSEIDLGA